jgi:phasin protein
MSKHRKSQGHKLPSDKKQKANGKKEVKDKIVAAEFEEAVKRQEAPKPAAAPASPSVPPVMKAVARDQTPEPSPMAVKAKAPPPPPQAATKAKASEPTPSAVKDKTPEPPRHLLETAVETFERTVKAAGQGTVAVNRKLLDFTRANVSSGFDFAMSLASASSPVQIMQLQMSYWDERMKVLASQAQELRALSADLVAKANEPIREHIRRAQLG